MEISLKVFVGGIYVGGFKPHTFSAIVSTGYTVHYVKN